MRVFTFILVFISISIKPKEVNAKYAPISLHSMILRAELAIQGEIERVGNKYYYLKVSNKVLGNYNSPTIKIKKFQNWTCAQRWADYKEGQKVLVFLTKDTSNDWAIMSGGGEGELPIMKENIYFNSYDFNTLIPIKSGIYKVYSGNFSGIKLNLNEFIITISDLRGCFKYLNGDNIFSWNIKLICPIERINFIKRKSLLNTWLIDECLTTIANGLG